MSAFGAHSRHGLLHCKCPLLGAKRTLVPSLTAPERFVENFFWAERQLNPDLVQAFDARNESPDHFNNYKRLERRVMKKLMAEAKAMPDPEATAHAMRITGTGKVPEDRPPNYAAMSDSEFEAAKKKLFKQAP
jgi:hypothetical protein